LPGVFPRAEEFSSPVFGWPAEAIEKQMKKYVRLGLCPLRQNHTFAHLQPIGRPDAA
jgi:hypothetical protein